VPIRPEMQARYPADWKLRSRLNCVEHHNRPAEREAVAEQMGE